MTKQGRGQALLTVAAVLAALGNDGRRDASGGVLVKGLTNGKWHGFRAF